jgi:hypothetical protein
VCYVSPQYPPSSNADCKHLSDCQSPEWEYGQNCGPGILTVPPRTRSPRPV